MGALGNFLLGLCGSGLVGGVFLYLSSLQARKPNQQQPEIEGNEEEYED